MSRAFVKDDVPNERLLVPQRAPLPPGEPNLVTPRGRALLEAERAELTAEIARVQGEEEGAGDYAQRLAVLRERLGDLEARLASARVVEPPAPGTAERGRVGFGAAVTVTGLGAGEERLRVVGVDEADAEAGLVAFTAPIARALDGLAIGDEARLRVGRRERRLTVTAVDYPAPDPSAGT